MQCPICLEDLAPAAFRVLDCGNNHSICVTCLQGLETGLGGAFATNEQGPRGALINYINLPGCPICRARFHLVPHVADPVGRDNYQNNNPVATDLPRFYYDTQGLTPAEVQTWVIDAAANAVAAVNNLAAGGETDDETDEDETDEDETDEEETEEDETEEETEEEDQNFDDYQDQDAAMDVDDPGGVRSLGYHVCDQCNQQAEFVVYDTGAQYREESTEEDYDCAVCNQEIEDDDQNVRACMGCFAGWHEGC